MEPKPSSAAGYSSSAVERVRRACLYLATKLGDFRDELVIVGGLVPSLLAPATRSASHIGTLDVDLGLAVGLLQQQRYRELCERLRSAGLAPDANVSGNPTSQRWRIDAEGQSVTVDFLIPPLAHDEAGGRLRHLEAGFAAVVTPGLELAFADKRLIALEGETLQREQARREVWVCEAGAFTVLKALAFENRGENKDAYDLVYVLQNYGRGIGDVYQRLRPLLAEPIVHRALAILERDFCGMDGLGAMRAAKFLGSAHDDNARADAAGAVRSLLERCRSARTDAD